MTKYTSQKPNPKNERIKRDYLRHVKEARRRAISTVDGVRKALTRFEEYAGYKDFSGFNKEQAIGFKNHLLTLKAHRTDEPLSKATMLHTLNALKEFFRWLACQPGFKSRIIITDIDYLSLSDKEARAARAVRYGSWPTMEQIRKVIFSMPNISDIQRRNRALIAFGIVTGMRDSAIASIRLKHIHLERHLVTQDPKEVKTKFSKRIDSFFFPVGDDLTQIVRDWVTYLRIVKHYGPDDPVFPQTRTTANEDHCFVAEGLRPNFWASTTPIRKIYQQAFTAAGLPYFNPHSFRKTLVDFGQRHCKNPEEFKAWSQNMGHDDVLTTFTNYGHISPDRQGEVIQSIGRNDEKEDKLDAIMRQLETLTR